MSEDDWLGEKIKGGEIPFEVRNELNEAVTTPFDTGAQSLVDKGWEAVNDIDDDNTRDVVATDRAPEMVFKLVEDSRVWENERELDLYCENWSEHVGGPVPDPVRKYLAPIYDCGRAYNEPRWIAMQRAETEGLRKAHGKRIWKELKKEGWGVGDLFLDNIGLIDGHLVLIDYVHLRPIDSMARRTEAKVKEGRKWK